MKHFTRFTLFSGLLALAFFAVLPGLAQTHTPRYISMATHTKGYYEYLPAGYDANGTTRYPLLLFITGVGEFGQGNTTDLPKVLKNGVPKLINAGTFPTSFTVNGQTHRFIVITPQFVTSPRPVPTDVEAVLNYIVTHYKVDTSRMYITGLSYGGGIAWAYPGDNSGYAKRIAATAPVASAAPLGGDSAIYARSRTMAANNVPVWAFHNNGDSTAPVTTTNSYISYINQAPAPTPLAKKTIVTSNGHDAWTKAYSPAYKEDGLNVYEWMLQYKRNTSKSIQVNIYGGSNPYNSTAWNNWNIGTVEASNITSTAFKYSDGTTSAVTATLSHTRPIVDNGSTYGGGMAPAQVLRYTSSSTLTRTLTLKGLSATRTYNLEFYASRASSTAGSTVFTVSGKSVTINTVNNLTNKATFTNIAPNTSGQIVVSIGKTSTYSYINGFAITENGAVSYTKFVKTNIYGGSNPYSSTAWNNWNIGTAEASNINSAAFKYSDGSTSAISATLSHTRPIVDNGATYGGGMAPAQVLRYTSSSTLIRTLTLKGLSTSKTYSLELYASRASSTAGSTVFTVSGKSVTINTVNNLTNKATFTNIAPNTSGQIVVSIGKTSTYSYINGFMLTEGSGGAMAMANALEVADARTVTEQPVSPGVKVHPNPVADAVWLTMESSYAGAVQVQLADATGKVCRTFHFAKGSAVLRQSLSVGGLAKGLYFVVVQAGNRRQTLPVLKQ
jgi:dienelactone hydrolase